MERESAAFQFALNVSLALDYRGSHDDPRCQICCGEVSH